MAGAESEIRIRFHGEGAGTGELTWGQRGIWDTIQRTGRTMNIGGVMALPEGTPVEEIAGVLRFAVSRHQALSRLPSTRRPRPGWVDRAAALLRR